MPKVISHARIRLLKSKAKRLCKQHPDLKLYQAQQQIADAEGFANWSLLAKAVPVNAPTHEVKVASDSLEKIRAFDELIKEVNPSPMMGEQPINFADVEWIANEAKACGLMTTEGDAQILINVFTARSCVSPEVCWEEIRPVLANPPAFHSKSSIRLSEMVGQSGVTAISRASGISIPTIDKLIGGGLRGRIMRPHRVNQATIAKAKTFLAKN